MFKIVVQSSTKGDKRTSRPPGPDPESVPGVLKMNLFLEENKFYSTRQRNHSEVVYP